MHRIRTCVATRERKADTELLRVVVEPGTSQLLPDPRRCLDGRGAWVTPSLEAVETAVSRRAFERALKLKSAANPELVREYVRVAGTKNGKT